MRLSELRKTFRAVLAGDTCVHPASVFDAPDLIVLTLSEFADQAYRIGRAADLPLLVDADHGYGNALNVMRTVEELETAGVAALSIEDTDLPRGFGPRTRRSCSPSRRVSARCGPRLPGAVIPTWRLRGAPAPSASPASRIRSSAPRPMRQQVSTPCSWSASRRASSSRLWHPSCVFPSFSAAEARSGIASISPAR